MRVFFLVHKGVGHVNPYNITCSSTVDIDPEYLTQHHIAYLPFHFRLHQNDYQDDFGQSFSLSDFYEAIRQGALPTTSQNNPEEYCVFFEPFLQKGEDILHLAFSSGLSGDYQSACIAKDLLKEIYPDRNIYIVDSLAASSGYGLLLTDLIAQKQAGLTLDELATYTLDKRLTIQHWFFSSDLAHYKRGGRISATSATIGGLLNICPVMTMDIQGKLVPKYKVRGKKKALHALVDECVTHVSQTTDPIRCLISHSDCEQEAHLLANELKQALPQKNMQIDIYPIGTVIGSHTGPGTVALFFTGDMRH